jgi:CheY-like chemotaxis protein
MPIVDGLTSTKMIRSFEKLNSGNVLSTRAARNGRVPIFAVSASLVERERQTYINAGFDAWVLKPIDFKRLNVLLLGIVDDDARQSCLYKPGSIEASRQYSKHRQPHQRNHQCRVYLSRTFLNSTLNRTIAANLVQLHRKWIILETLSSTTND